MIISVGFRVLHLKRPSFYSLNFSETPQQGDFCRLHYMEQIVRLGGGAYRDGR